MARIGGREYQALRSEYRAACVAQDLPCWMDGQPIAYDVPDSSTDDSFELDHYHPVSTHPQLEMDPANFRPSHRLCNRTRGNGTPAPPINNTSRNWTTPPTPKENNPHAEQPHTPEPRTLTLRERYALQ